MQILKFKPSILFYHQWATRVSFTGIFTNVTCTQMETEMLWIYISNTHVSRISPLNFAGVVVTTLFIGQYPHIHLLEY